MLPAHRGRPRHVGVGAGAEAVRTSVRTLVQEEAAIASERRLARLTACVRLGPMVGLVGTLIPLGPGLVALSQGDLAQMASHLTVAFTVTVVVPFAWITSTGRLVARFVHAEYQMKASYGPVAASVGMNVTVLFPLPVLPSCR